MWSGATDNIDVPDAVIQLHHALEPISSCKVGQQAISTWHQQYYAAVIRFKRLEALCDNIIQNLTVVSRTHDQGISYDQVEHDAEIVINECEWILYRSHRGAKKLWSFNPRIKSQANCSFGPETITIGGLLNEAEKSRSDTYVT